MLQKLYASFYLILLELSLFFKDTFISIIEDRSQSKLNTDRKV